MKITQEHIDAVYDAATNELSTDISGRVALLDEVAEFLKSHMEQEKKPMNEICCNCKRVYPPDLHGSCVCGGNTFEKTLTETNYNP